MTPPNPNDLVYQDVWEYDILGVEWHLYMDNKTGRCYWVPMVSQPDWAQATLKEVAE
jgi:hypothetical protein